MEFSSVECPDIRTAMTVLHEARSRAPGVCAYGGSYPANTHNLTPDTAASLPLLVQKESSRGHFFFRIVLHKEQEQDNSRGRSYACELSTLTLVDLVGNDALQVLGTSTLLRPEPIIKYQWISYFCLGCLAFAPPPYCPYSNLTIPYPEFFPNVSNVQSFDIAKLREEDRVSIRTKKLQTASLFKVFGEMAALSSKSRAGTELSTG